MLAACAAPPPVVILAQTDYAPVDEFAALRYTVRDIRDGVSLTGELPADRGADYVRGVVLAELEIGTGSYEVTASLIDADGAVIDEDRFQADVARESIVFFAQIFRPVVTPPPPTDHYAAIALAEDFGCALRELGDLFCFGGNRLGQLGQGHRFPVEGLARVELPPARAVGVAGVRGCALLGGGTVSCWGADDAGDALRPAEVPDLADVVELAVGDPMSCARTTTAEVRCWGGELGAIPVAIPDAAGAVEITVGHRLVTAPHGCARMGDGTVRCWGDDQFGTLGDGPGVTATSGPTETVAVVGLDGPAVALFSGPKRTCARTESGDVFCWGVVIADSSVETTESATAVSALTGAERIALGIGHVCTLRGGEVACSGANEWGQLGRGTASAIEEESVPVALEAPVTALAVSWRHSCATTEEAIFCWGSNGAAQLGTDVVLTSAAPARIDGRFDELVARGDVTCGITDDAIACWGDHPMLGDPSSIPRTLELGLEAPLRHLALGPSHACVRTSHVATRTSAVTCWGENASGQLGVAPSEGTLAPVEVAGLADEVLQIALGDAFTCARTSAGEVYCWGADDEGQLGDGVEAETRAPPAPVVGLCPGVTDLMAGGGHACALCGDGRIFCWGRGGSGELGTRTEPTSFSDTPIEVPGIGPASRVAAGGSATMAVLADGTVWGWGRGPRGLLGPLSDMTPRAIVGVGMAFDVELDAHACALVGTPDRGALYCWGPNHALQLGTEAFFPDGSELPVPVQLPPGLLGPDRVAIGTAHTCTLRFGTAYCWGANDRGQLGDGRLVRATSPLRVD